MTLLISVAAEKGGVGKTTTATHLAAHLAAKGKTLLLDADTHLRSAYKWIRKAATNGYNGWSVDVMLFDEFTRQRDVASQYDFLVLDTKGGEGPEALVTLAKQSALLIVPTKPDGVSGDGLVETLRPLIEKNVTNYRVLLTDVPPAPNADGLEMRLELRSLGIPLFAHQIRHGVSVSKAAQQGVCVRDVKGDRYAKLVWMDYELVTSEVLEATHVQAR